MTDTTTRFILLPTEENFVLLLADTLARYDIGPDAVEITQMADAINKTKLYVETLQSRVNKLEELVLATNRSVFGDPGFQNANLGLFDRWVMYHSSIKDLMPLVKLKKWVDGIRRSLINSTFITTPQHWNTTNLGPKIEAATVGEFASNAPL